MITKDSKRILFADDSEFYRARFNEILTHAGHKTQTVNNGKEVIEALKTNSEGIDLLILALQMPEVDGYEVLTWIRDNNLAGRFPVLAITSAHEPTHILMRLKAFGKVSLILKNLSPEQVIHKVNRLLFPDKFARGEPRVPISIPVDCSVEGVTWRGNLLNLSASGLFLHTAEELQKDTVVNLKFHIPVYDNTIDINGLVVWSTDLSEEDSFFGGAGIQFLDIFSKEQDILSKFVTKELCKLGLNE
jgi:CheY-like chemotaxis protein